MEIKCEYDAEEVEKMVLEAHQENFPVPDGMEWHAVQKTYGGCEVIAIKKKDKQTTEQQPEVLIIQEVYPL